MSTKTLRYKLTATHRRDQAVTEVGTFDDLDELRQAQRRFLDLAMARATFEDRYLANGAYDMAITGVYQEKR